ncbi:MAG: DUF4954 family protein, partial [Bacteroidales bacterium]|nr:DUF4954 family protein [Bacteroidales bacterium]
MEYRCLSAAETAALEKNGCRCEDWTKVRAAWGKDSYTDYISETEFSGDINLGRFDKTITLPGGLERHSRISKACLHNVTIGDNCIVNNIGEYLANYSIGDNCIIENVDLLTVDGRCTFGNGVEVSVLNETGGREVAISDKLSAHTAYVMAMYRHRSTLHDRLEEITRNYADKHASEIGTIGNDVT